MTHWLGLGLPLQAPPANVKLSRKAFQVHMLPLDVLETVCAHFDKHHWATLKSFIALTSCCKAIWQREDVLASTKLWGYLDLHARSCQNYTAVLSVAAWVSRHCRGLRKCELFISDYWPILKPFRPATLLPLTDALVDSSLTTLRVHFPMEAVLREELAQLLPRLPTLPDLRIYAMASRSGQLLPDQLSVLCGLRALSIYDFEATIGLRENETLGKPTWQFLPCLKALTAFRIGCCKLTALPPQLSALTRLARFSISWNYELDHGTDISNSSHEAWAPLQRLTALTKLKLDNCDLRRLPGALASLGQLRKLGLGGNSQLGRVPGAWEPLSALTALTTLQLSGCGIDRLPGQLSALCVLEELDISWNPELSWGRAAWEPVQALTALARLYVHGVRLLRPPELPETCRAAQCLRSI
ncbi:hypothetical protein N2152v2_009664 [Parachlorella kessleri]